MKSLRLQSNRRLLILGFAVLVTGGCVVAPVPLVETTQEKHQVEPDKKHPGVEIVTETRTWFMPIVASAEGPAKMRSRNSSHAFYWVWTESKKRESLPFLDVATDNGLSDPWRDFRAIEGTEWILALRFAMDDKWYTEKRKQGEELQETKIEIAVFSRTALKQRRTIETVRNVQSKKYRYNTVISKDGRTMDYFTAQGRRRYYALEDREETLPDSTPLEPSTPSKSQ